MRTLAIILLSIGLAACGGAETEAPGAATQRGIDRSVADIRAAEAATRQEVVISRSVGELTGKAAAKADAPQERQMSAKGEATAATPPAG